MSYSKGAEFIAETCCGNYCGNLVAEIIVEIFDAEIIVIAVEVILEIIGVKIIVANMIAVDFIVYVLAIFMAVHTAIPFGKVKVTS